MKFLQKIILVLVFLVAVTGLQAQIKDQKVEKVKISGNCSMCKETIEKTGTQPSVSKVIWDPETKIATITYDTKQISLDNILKKIAQAGYSNDRYKAKKSDYNKLPPCCQY